MEINLQRLLSKGLKSGGHYVTQPYLRVALGALVDKIAILKNFTDPLPEHWCFETLYDYSLHDDRIVTQPFMLAVGQHF